MKVLEPLDIAAGRLVSSSVPFDDYLLWSAGMSYGIGARVIRAGQVSIYESVVDANVGHDPASDAANWLAIGTANRWSMFDDALGSATTATGNIEVVLETFGAVDTLAVLDTNATSVRVRLIDGATTLYDQTQAPTGSMPLIFSGLPIHATARITLTITVAAGPVEVGTVIIGTLAELGLTEQGPTIGINDFSRRETDDFGVTTITERGWAKRMTARCMLPSDAVDAVQARLATLRGKPSLWIAEQGYDALTIFGFYKDFSIDLVAASISYCSLTIEGLTEAPQILPPEIIPGPPGPAGPAGVDGTDGPPGASAFSLVNVRNCDLTPTTITHIGGSTWGALACTLESAATAQVSATMPPGTFIAIDRDPQSSTSPEAFADMDYALHNSSDGNWYRVAASAFDVLGPSSGAGTGSVRSDGISVFYSWPGGVISVPLSTPVGSRFFGAAIPSPGAVITDFAYSVAGIAGSPGLPGTDGDPGDKGEPAIGFVSDANPGPGQFVSQTWYRPTPKEWYRWDGADWQRMLGDLATKDLIAESALIGDAVIISAKIHDLAVTTLKVADGAITSLPSVSGSRSWTAGDTWVDVFTLTHSIYGSGSKILLTLSGVMLIGDAAPTNTAMKLRINRNGVFGDAIYVSNVRRAYTPLYIPQLHTGLSGSQSFTVQVYASQASGLGDPHLFENAFMCLQEFKK